MDNDDTNTDRTADAATTGTPGTGPTGTAAASNPSMPSGPVPARADGPPRTGSRFRMRRSPDDVMLAGVCAGLAEELDLDPALVRLAVVVLTVLTSGALALVYLVAWILAPIEGPARTGASA